ncbi:uncharacterized protein [Clytia hemisphaerica]|uniref:uncharacterized protein isoform X2 n=1 Tax=Clytia hemisphaerica TaxID=252671 RepID=UPI0034D4CE86
MTVMDRSPPRVPIHSSSTSSLPELEAYRFGGPISMVSRRSSSTTSSENMMIGNNSNNNTQTSMEDDKKFQMGGDDEEMKRARRRMKNKISAQESRRRKKEYVDALELKMKQRDQEKRLLTEKVTELEDRVRQLVDQLFHAKQNNRENTSTTMTDTEPFVRRRTTDAGTQTGICLDCYLQTPSKVLLTERQIKHETEEEFPSNELTNENELDPTDCLNHQTSTQTSPYKKTFIDDFHPENERFHPYRINREHYREIPENRDRFREIADFQENREHVRYSSSLSYQPSESHRRSSVSYPKSPERYSSPHMARYSPTANRSASPSHVSDRAPTNPNLDRDLRQNSMVLPPQATFRRISNASPPSAEKMIPYSKY